MTRKLSYAAGNVKDGRVRLGVDTGGTFTDLVWLNNHGHIQISKVLSTPDDPSRAILTGVDLLQVPDQAAVVHGSTVATNALLERRGARTALITTTGFADVLAIGRQNRPDLYALVPQKPEPLVARRWRFEVRERITAQGEILQPVDLDSLKPILNQLRSDGIESVAVSLIFSFLVPAHEQMIGQMLQEWAASEGIDLHVSLSSEILPEYREYERTSTTVINAYVAPLMSRYLTRLASGLHPRRLSVMQSNGGVISAAAAGTQAARTVLSGPAGGVVGARFVASQAGFQEIITFDMGGTSTDVSLCPGSLPTTSEGEIAGQPLRLPIIDIHTVGAGGGSLAYLDAGGALHVGPQSAGAHPGPACYGRDIGDWKLEAAGQISRQPVTTTDANLILGRLDTEHFLGGGMRLDLTRSRDAIAELTDRMGEGASPEEASWGIIQLANANMERAIRRISVERGYDPRLFTLVAFGGAGPLHACELAESMQISRVLIPAFPGVLSALGMLAAAPTKDYSKTVMRVLAPSDHGRSNSDAWWSEQFGPVEERALFDMSDEGYMRDELLLARSLDVRYLGQSHELTIPCGSTSVEPQIVNAFHQAHLRRYGYQQPDAIVEVVNLRIAVAASVTQPILAGRKSAENGGAKVVLGSKPVWFGGDWVEAVTYDRDGLVAGDQLDGPAIIFQYDTTTVVPPGWHAAVDGQANLILSLA